MKKRNLNFVLVAFIVSMFVFASCQKLDDGMQPNKKTITQVAVTHGRYVVKNGDLTTKDAPIGQTVVWTMLTNNGTFYSADPYYAGYGNLWLVRGKELLTGTSPYAFWALPSNNPISFADGTQLVSNDTPDEDVRIIAETYDVDGNLVYIAMLDFNPDYANFPLTINGYRFGDELYIDWSQIHNLPGAQNLSLKAKFAVSPTDATATRSIAYGSLSGTPATPNGKELVWADLKYGTPGATQTVDVPGTGKITVLNTVSGKIFGNVTIELYEGTELLASQDVAVGLPGFGNEIDVTTDKVGSYWSQTMGVYKHDVFINGHSIVMH